jgi:hypothetical protein
LFVSKLLVTRLLEHFWFFFNLLAFRLLLILYARFPFGLEQPEAGLVSAGLKGRCRSLF